MRKALIITLAVLLLFSCCFVAANGAVNTTKNQVTWNETTLYGDRSHADGLTIQSMNAYFSSLLWKSNYTVGKSSQPETVFSFANQTHEPYYESSYAGLHLYAGFGLYDYKYLDNMSDYAKEKYAYLIEYYKETYDMTPEGTHQTYAVDLADYADYYSLEGMFDLPGSHMSFFTEFDGKSDFGSELPHNTGQIINEYFKIPIYGSCHIDWTIDKDYDNISYSYGSSPEYSPHFTGIDAGNAVYFTFNTHVDNDTVIDTSHINGGYGIYKINYSTNQYHRAIVDIESLDTVFSLDPSESYHSLHLSDDGKQLLLLTEKDGILLLTVIDIDTMTQLQYLELAEGAAEYSYDFRLEKDYFTVIHQDPQTEQDIISVYSQNPDCTYAHAFTVPMDGNGFSADEAMGLCDYGNYALAFDGSYLAIAQNTHLQRENPWDYEVLCGFYIVVYDESGMLYAGEYATSLDSYNAERSAPFGENALTITWE